MTRYTIIFALAALALAAALPSPDVVVPEQELAQSKHLGEQDYYDIYGTGDDGQLESDAKKNDETEGPKAASDELGTESSKDADEIKAEVDKEEKEDIAEDAKEKAIEAKPPSEEETLKTMVQIYGKKEIDPSTGKTYQAALDALYAKRKKIAAAKAAAEAKEEAKEEAETEAAEKKYDEMNAEALKVTEDDAKDEEVRGYEEAKKDGEPAPTPVSGPVPPPPPAKTDKSLDCDRATGDVNENC